MCAYVDYMITILSSRRTSLYNKTMLLLWPLILVDRASIIISQGAHALLPEYGCVNAMCTRCALSSVCVYCTHCTKDNKVFAFLLKFISYNLTAHSKFYYIFFVSKAVYSDLLRLDILSLFIMNWCVCVCREYERCAAC